MAKKNGPYIGVTGFMSRAEVGKALAVVPQKSSHRLMVGVLMSSKTLAGEQAGRPGRYPKKEAVADIFVNDPRILNLVHYSTSNTETLLGQLMEITDLAGPDLDGFQFNIAWPSILQLEDYRKLNPDKFLPGFSGWINGCIHASADHHIYSRNLILYADRYRRCSPVSFGSYGFAGCACIGSNPVCPLAQV